MIDYSKGGSAGLSALTKCNYPYLITLSMRNTSTNIYRLQFNYNARPINPLFRQLAIHILNATVQLQSSESVMVELGHRSYVRYRCYQ